MINIYNGSILNAKTDFIMHQVNCQSVMGSGVAKVLRDFDEGIFTHYKAVSEHRKLHNIPLLGDNDYYWIMNHNNQQCIVSMFAQDKYGYDGNQYTDYEAFRTCLRQFKASWSAWVEDIDKNNNKILRRTSVALPYNIGCGRGGGDWEEIYLIIKEELIDYDVELWRLDVDDVIGGK